MLARRCDDTITPLTDTPAGGYVNSGQNILTLSRRDRWNRFPLLRRNILATTSVRGHLMNPLWRRMGSLCRISSSSSSSS